MRINTLIEQTRSNLTDSVNKALNEGIPISVIKLILNNLSLEVEQTLRAVIKQEAKSDQGQTEQVQALDEADYEVDENN